MNISTTVTTEQVIEALVASQHTGNQDPRLKHLFRESLRNLVRLAKTEQLQEMKNDVARVTCPTRRAASSAFMTREQ